MSDQPHPLGLYSLGDVADLFGGGNPSWAAEPIDRGTAAAFESLARLKRLTYQNCLDPLLQGGRGFGPVFVYILFWLEVEVTPAARKRMVATAWSSSEQPVTLKRIRWELMFAWSGFFADRQRVYRPAEPVTAFRGATPDRAKDMAWSARIEAPRRFAEAGGGSVYQAVLEPDWIAGRCLLRGEDEYVVYPHCLDRLRPELVETPEPRLPVLERPRQDSNLRPEN